MQNDRKSRVVPLGFLLRYYGKFVSLEAAADVEGQRQICRRTAAAIQNDCRSYAERNDYSSYAEGPQVKGPSFFPSDLLSFCLPAAVLLLICPSLKILPKTD